ncbi:hypothetical protein AMECASPLE_034723 [Ameca splendens]|uniref:Uncharacterized protein n=1 Tax=Ameca splendens TaxID=208324 RepID=A0ABV0YJ57_9TELE
MDSFLKSLTLIPTVEAEAGQNVLRCRQKGAASRSLTTGESDVTRWRKWAASFMKDSSNPLHGLFTTLRRMTAQHYCHELAKKMFPEAVTLTSASMHKRFFCVQKLSHSARY